VFNTLLGLVRHGLGGSAGDGRQFMSWIHYDDFVAALQWLIDRDDISGVVNPTFPIWPFLNRPHSTPTTPRSCEKFWSSGSRVVTPAMRPESWQAGASIATSRGHLSVLHPLFAQTISFGHRPSTGRRVQRPDPLEHRPEQPPGQVALGQQEPVVPGVPDQSPARLDEALLETG
jgi:hypothetical protein